MSVSVCQIRVTSEPQRTFFLKLDSGDDLGAGFVLVLCDGVSAWGGEVSEEDVTREARELEMEREKYVEDLWLALAGKGQKGDHTFHLSSSSPNSGTLHLSYEKVQKNISVSERTAVVLLFRNTDEQSLLGVSHDRSPYCAE
ncbi:hypothetical protein Z043_106005, partial [Scleropages formosus]